MIVETQKLYIAGMGAVSPLGSNVAMTNSAVTAGISRYEESDYFVNDRQKALVTAEVPDQVLFLPDLILEQGTYYCGIYDRILKMSILSLQQAVQDVNLPDRVPLILAMSEPAPDIKRDVPNELLLENISAQTNLPVQREDIRILKLGRASAMSAIDYAFRYCYELDSEFVLVSASDSYLDRALLESIGYDRLLAAGCMDAFAPGEAGASLLLTKNKNKALLKDGNVIALSRPGIAEEPGHLKSDVHCVGEGLDLAVKKSLNGNTNIQTIYNTMNGERFWSKEFGVMMIRNKKAFIDNVDIRHPAEYYGDVGAASGALLVILAAENMFGRNLTYRTLVYASSDSALRGALILDRESV